MTDPVPARFRAFRAEPRGDAVRQVLTEVERDSLPDHDVAVRVAYSSLNYKDALSASGHRGVTRSYPHTPGIDAAGTVVGSRDPRFAPGDRVIVTSYDLGMNTPGGFGEFVRVPGDWVVPLPAGLDLREAMILGTAGLTAGLSLAALQRHGLAPENGPVAVTGASGGVGTLAVALLAGRGYEVIASTGKREAHELLRFLGARAFLERSELAEPSERPLLRGRFAGAVDTVGGRTLENLVKSLGHGGAVAACGLVGGHDLQLTVYPFILRGVALLGVDSGECPMAQRREVWNRLAAGWKPQGLDRLVTEITLEGLADAVRDILRGAITGRVLVRVGGG